MSNKYLTKKFKGSEKFIFNDNETDISLLDFWKWRYSNIYNDKVFSDLSKFIVASALELIGTFYHDGYSFDIKLSNNVKIIVKNAKRMINESRKKEFVFDIQDLFNDKIIDEKINIVVFSIYNQETPDESDILNLNNWRFIPVSIKKIWDFFDDKSQKITKDELLALYLREFTYKTLRKAIRQEKRY